jgi:putative membrane protein
MNRIGGGVTWTFVVLHALALTLGLFGLLVAIPHPQLFAGNAPAIAFYSEALNNTGGTGMLLGTLAMLSFGIWRLGVRRTLLFFIAATVISAAAELTGTKTGWPFGGYEYTNFLGPKLLGRVPVAIPLSWFYMGFASYVLADAIVAARAARNRTLWSIVLGTWLLVAWDLVLDPSMAAPNMQYIHFWVWHESGPYFGMPLRNLVGWFGTGLLFIAVGRLAWNEADAPRVPIAVPYAVYAINIVWSMILSVSAGMWPTALAAIVFSLLPAALAFRGAREARA